MSNKDLFTEFNLLVSSKTQVMNAAYQTLQDLYPTSLITPIEAPITGDNVDNTQGYMVDVDSFDLGLNPVDERLGFGLYLEPIYGYQVRVQFDQTLGRTRQGSIVTGYRYRITTIPRGLNLFYIDDGADEIDVYFRSELMKLRIPSLNVTRVV